MFPPGMVWILTYKKGRAIKPIIGQSNLSNTTGNWPGVTTSGRGSTAVLRSMAINGVFVHPCSFAWFCSSELFKFLRRGILAH